MSIVLNVYGKTWIVPDSAVGNLVGWLESNAVEADNGRPKLGNVESLREKDDRVLLTEEQAI